MKIKHFIFLILFASFSFPAHAQSPLWSGVVDPARAANWQNAGVIGGIPSATWTQCGSTIAAYNGNVDTINNAIIACTANHYVQLGAGTFNLSSGGALGGIVMKTGVVLRGMGANQTFLIIGAGAMNGCGGGRSAGTCFNGNAGTGAFETAVDFATVTAGFNQGSNVITLSTVTGVVANQSLIMMDQCSSGNSGVTCSLNAEVDNGNFFPCNILWNGTAGCADNGPDNGLQRTNRPQEEWFLVTAVNAGTKQVTLSDPIRYPDWSTSRSVAVVHFPNPVMNSGVENLSLDMTANNAYGVTLLDTVNSWVRGVRIIKSGQGAILPAGGAHNTIQDNYIFGTTHAPGTDSFGIYGVGDSSNLIQNNIVQQIQVCMGVEGADTGSVYAYNFCPASWAGGNFIYPASFQHGLEGYLLYEGNVLNSIYDENLHGPKLVHTIFRNFVTGWESCQAAALLCGGATSKIGLTTAIRLVHHSRYPNVVANVLGTPGIHNAYSTTSTGQSALFIYEIGSPNAAPTDAVVNTTKYFYGNYDVVSGGGVARYCGSIINTGWAGICGSVPEVPTGISVLPQPLPTKGDTVAGQPAFPASFYLPSKPGWFGPTPWPPIGPDVTGGNVGQCGPLGGFSPSGTANVAGQFAGVAATAGKCTGTTLDLTKWAGHVNAIPAVACALNVMGMPPDGSGGVLSFNADICYASAAVLPYIITGTGKVIGTGTVKVQ